MELEVDPEPVKSPPPRRVPGRNRRASFHRSTAASPVPSVKSETQSPSRESSPKAPVSPKSVTRQSPVRSPSSKASKRPTR